MDRDLLRRLTNPDHYDSDANLDVIDFCHMYNISFSRGNIIKYLVRAGRKDNELKDLYKALDYLQREIEFIKQIEQ
jgi:hypothetical protein